MQPRWLTRDKFSHESLEERAVPAEPGSQRLICTHALFPGLELALDQRMRQDFAVRVSDSAQRRSLLRYQGERLLRLRQIARHRWLALRMVRTEQLLYPAAYHEMVVEEAERRLRLFRQDCDEGND